MLRLSGSTPVPLSARLGGVRRRGWRDRPWPRSRAVSPGSSRRNRVL